jgi:uncharacterized membrane protein
MPDTAAFCPGCGRRMRKPAPRAQERVGMFRENLAGALAYLTFVPAIYFLVVDPYKKSFVRFHSVQCLLLWGVAIIVVLALWIASPLFFLIPVAGPLLMLLICVISGLAAVLLWLVLVIKALQGEMFKLPWVGRYAAEYSGEPTP